MSTQTPVCELLGIDHPIVEAPLSADPRLPAAVSNAGGLGTLGLGWADDAGEVVRETAALTDRPFAGNFVLAFDQHHRIDQALSAGLRIVSLFWGDPNGYVDSVHDAGGLVMHTVGSAEEARHAAGCGVDIVVAQGWEAGRARLEWRGNAPACAGGSRRGDPGTGYCGRWDRRRSRSRGRAGPRRAGRLARHAVPVSR